MSRHIYLGIGVGDAIQPDSLIKSLNHSYAILRELDASVTGATRGGIEWGIDTIKKGSPLEVAFVGDPKTLHVVDPLEQIQSALIDGLNTLSDTKEEPERPPHYSDKALKAAQKLADLRKRGDIGEIEVYTSPSFRAPITTSVSRAVHFLIGAAFESEGSIVGSLDSITVHRSHEFRVWDELSGRPVTCKFSREKLGDVKEGLKRRVLVHGKITRNVHGLPVGITVDGIEPQPEESELPTIEEMSGLVNDPTWGSTLKEHLEDIRGG